MSGSAVDWISLPDLARERGMDRRVLLGLLKAQNAEFDGKLLSRKGGSGSHWWVNRAPFFVLSTATCHSCASTMTFGER